MEEHTRPCQETLKLPRSMRKKYLVWEDSPYSSHLLPRTGLPTQAYETNSKQCQPNKASSVKRSKLKQAKQIQTNKASSSKQCKLEANSNKRSNSSKESNLKQTKQAQTNKASSVKQSKLKQTNSNKQSKLKHLRNTP